MCFRSELIIRELELNGCIYLRVAFQDIQKGVFHLLLLSLLVVSFQGRFLASWSLRMYTEAPLRLL